MSITLVWIKARFVAYHSWPDAPDSEDYLRNKHRHEFHVDIGWEVNHDDRDVEFHAKKKELYEMLDADYNEKDLGALSCEMIAKDLLIYFDAHYCEVSEDGECGAIVYA